MAGVLRALVVVDLARQRPAVVAVVALGPPAVEHAELQPAVDGVLHAARPAGLQRRPRHVDPDVAAADEPRGDAEVVVLEEDDALEGALLRAHGEQLLHEALAAVVARMRLAGQQQLDRPLAAEQREAALDVVQQQVQALVRRQPAREADRQDARVERPRRRLDEVARVAARDPLQLAAVADVIDEQAALLAAHRPELRGRDRVDRRERRRIGRPQRPALAEMAIEQAAHRRADPGRDMDAVGHMADRDLVDRALGPQHLPHLARDGRRGAGSRRWRHGSRAGRTG